MTNMRWLNENNSIHLKIIALQSTYRDLQVIDLQSTYRDLQVIGLAEVVLSQVLVTS